MPPHFYWTFLKLFFAISILIFKINSVKTQVYENKRAPSEIIVSHLFLSELKRITQLDDMAFTALFA